MTRTARLLIAAGFLTVLTGAANAADLVTSAVDCSGRFFGCIAFNVGNKPLDVTVESLGVSTPLTLNPGDISPNRAACGGFNFCRFIGGSKRTLRGSYCVSATIGGPCDIVGEAR